MSNGKPYKCPQCGPTFNDDGSPQDDDQHSLWHHTWPPGGIPFETQTAATPTMHLKRYHWTGNPDAMAVRAAELEAIWSTFGLNRPQLEEAATIALQRPRNPQDVPEMATTLFAALAGVVDLVQP